jgi:hypothetical protein
VPIIEYGSDAELQLTKELLDNSYVFQLKKWQCIQKMPISGKNLHLYITNIYRDATAPIWAFVVFQTDRSNDQLKNNSIFDYANVKELWLEVSGKRYPEEFSDLNYDNDEYV